jgi:drug/metabolite transporter (DMT)-like permease
MSFEAPAPPAPVAWYRHPWFRQWGGYVLAALGAFLFASKGIWIKLAYHYQTDASSLLSLRLALATPVFVLGGVLTWWRARGSAASTLPAIDAEPWLYLKAMGVGVLGYWVASYTDFASLETLSPQFERMILFTYPLFVILFGAFFFGQAMRVSALWTFAIAYAGLALVFVTDLKAHGSAIAVGALWCMASSLAFALYLLLAKPLIRRLGPSMFTSFAMTGAAIATFTQFAFVHRLSDIHMSPALWSLGLGLAIGATVMPSYLTNFALNLISSQANAVISFINPVFTLVLSALLLKERITMADIAGTVLVIVGVGLYTFLDQRQSTRG